MISFLLNLSLQQKPLSDYTSSLTPRSISEQLGQVTKYTEMLLWHTWVRAELTLMKWLAMGFQTGNNFAVA